MSFSTRRRQSVVLTACLALLVISVAGCDAGKEELDLARNYVSLSELEAAGTDTVQIAPTGTSHVEGKSDQQFVVTEMDVVASAPGGTLAAGDVILIRQPMGNFANIAAVLNSSETYVAYVKPWERWEVDEDAAPGQFEIVGNQGVWRLKDDDLGVLVTPRSPLPKRVDVSIVDGDLEVTTESD